MLKLPKGLKKKKKGKSKKNQELFTEEELEQYKREHQRDRSGNEETSVTDNQNTVKPPSDDDEWSKFNALTTGIDTVLKNTQGNLDRIKESSFFQRVPVPSEESKKSEPIVDECKTLDDTVVETTSKQSVADRLAEAVITLSESEEESDETDDIFDTTYIDVIASGEVPLAYVPESPTEDLDLGPDPFDTTYAEKIIKGPEISKKGKRIVNIGSAVEVLTGRVEKVSTAIARRPRRGPQNLLLESFDADDTTTTTTTAAALASTTTGESNIVVSKENEPKISLLDDFTDDIPDIPIDLSVSLHLAYKQNTIGPSDPPIEIDEKPISNIVSEFDSLHIDDNQEIDEFAELAADSVAKKDEVIVIKSIPKLNTVEKQSVTNWSAFEEDNKGKSKPIRPPPPTVAIKPAAEFEEFSDEDLKTIEDDPFDTTFVENVIPLDDDDFDPRADEKTESLDNLNKLEQLSIKKTDLLGGSNNNLSEICPLQPLTVVSSFDKQIIDPFDTSAVSQLIQPKDTELKFLEKELCINQAATAVKPSISDEDFNPRADEVEQTTDYNSTTRRKSSLSLNFSSNTPHKSVVFAIPSTDLLSTDPIATSNSSVRIQKPLTPYYAEEELEEKDIDDPFDTSFVPTIKPTITEITILERDFLTEQSKLSHSISDQDFDPRAASPSVDQHTDLLAVEDNHNIKVLTPGDLNNIVNTKNITQDYLNDPFDTSNVDSNILPGQAELKLIENELLPVTNKSDTTTSVILLDTYTDSQELGLGDKVLTPQIPITSSFSIEEQDPFDTSFANNLQPGETEIKLLESELIYQQ